MTENLVGAESRYVVHPTILDATLQLSIVASHNGIPGRLKRQFIPFSIESLTISKPSKEDIDEPAIIEALANSEGDRRLVADLRMTSASDRPLVGLKNLQLVAPHGFESLGNGLIAPETTIPYSRIVWLPDYEFLSTAAVARLFPPVMLGRTSVAQALDELALDQLLQFSSSYAKFFQERAKQPPYLQYFLDWITSKVELAQDWPIRETPELSTRERAKRIEIRSSVLNTYSAESRTMCQIYDNLPLILSGKKTGIQVALQGNLLSEMYEDGQIINEGNRRLAATIRLLSHKKPRQRILEVGAGTGSATREILSALRGGTIYRKYKEYVYTDITPSFLKPAAEKFQMYDAIRYEVFDMQRPVTDQGLDGDFDLIIASNVIHASSNILNAMRNLRSLLKVGGKIVLLEITKPTLFAGLLLGTFSDYWNGRLDPNYPRYDGPFLSKETWQKLLTEASFGGIDFTLDDYAETTSSTVIASTAVDANWRLRELENANMDGLTIVIRDKLTKIASEIVRYAVSKRLHVDLTPLSDSQPARYTHQLYLVEAESFLFGDINATEWCRLRALLQQASHLLWVTNGGLLAGREPQFSIIQGILRGLKTEKRHLRICTVDFDHESCTASFDHICQTIMSMLKSLSSDVSEYYTPEYRQKDGIMYVSSLQPDDALNKYWESNTKKEAATEALPWSGFDNKPLKLDIAYCGSSSKTFYKYNPIFDKACPDDYVEIQVSASGVSSNANAAMKVGNAFDDVLSEYAGTVRYAGKNVSTLLPGDRVCGLGYGYDGTHARLKASFCHRLDQKASYDEMVTMLIAFCSAAHGLITLANLGENETTLIHADNDGVGWAAVQISKRRGAEVFLIVLTEAQKQEFLDAEMGLKDDHIFLVQEINGAEFDHKIGAKGVDVVLSTLPGPLRLRSLRCMAQFARFVQFEVAGTGDTVQPELDMRILQSKNATFSSFNLHAIAHSKPLIMSR